MEQRLVPGSPPRREFQIAFVIAGRSRVIPRGEFLVCGLQGETSTEGSQTTTGARWRPTVAAQQQGTGAREYA